MKLMHLIRDRWSNKYWWLAAGCTALAFYCLVTHRQRRGALMLEEAKKQYTRFRNHAQPKFKDRLENCKGEFKFTVVVESKNERGDLCTSVMWINAASVDEVRKRVEAGKDFFRIITISGGPEKPKLKLPTWKGVLEQSKEQPNEDDTMIPQADDEQPLSLNPIREVKRSLPFMRPFSKESAANAIVTFEYMRMGQAIIRSEMLAIPVYPTDEPLQRAARAIYVLKERHASKMDDWEIIPVSLVVTERHRTNNCINSHTRYGWGFDDVFKGRFVDPDTF